jgi:hypothetical protein
MFKDSGLSSFALSAKRITWWEALLGRAKQAFTPVLPGLRTQWIPEVVEVTLSAANQEFLMMAHADDSPHGVSEFINSLLVQERFRQGFPFPHDLKTHAEGLNYGNPPADFRQAKLRRMKQ